MQFCLRTATAVGAAATMALGGVVVASNATAATKATDVRVHMTKSRIRLSDSTVRAGAITFHPVSNDGKYHLMQLARIHKGYSVQQAGADLNKAFQGDVKAVRRIDHNISFRGGAPAPKSGDRGRVTVTLTKGHYVVLDQDGNGLAMLTVRGTAQGKPAARHDGVVTANSYNFTVGGHLPASGDVVFRNVSDQPHFVEMQRVKEGTTRRQVARALHSNKQPSFALRANTDSGVLSPYRHEVLHYNLPAGEYLLACWWPDDDSGMPHALMGMWRLVQIG